VEPENRDGTSSKRYGEGTEQTDAPTLELLTWLAGRPRSYGETIEAWRSNCPRLAVWDDALSAGLVRVAGKRVLLTEQGRSALHAADFAR
jgi:hypothetical protein